MKTTEWFISLEYKKYTFLIPHTYSSENGVIPEAFIDFDRIALDLFEVEKLDKHPIAITIKCNKTAMLTTSAVPSIVQINLNEFNIPTGLVEKSAKKNGLIAISFTDSGISLIINPELLHERWSKGI